MCSRTYWCHLGNGRQTVGQTLPPTPLISPGGTIAEQGVLRLSGKKIFPGFQVSGPVSWQFGNFCSEMANQEPPNIRGVASSTAGGGFSWECSSWQSFTVLFGNYEDQSSFRSNVWERDVGRPIGSERWTGPGCIRAGCRGGEGCDWVVLVVMCTDADFPEACSRCVTGLFADRVRVRCS